MATMRVACYARYSSDLQRETSLDDQLRVCREHAVREGWIVGPDHVYTDAALSGASLERPGIQALLAAAAQRPRPFDVVLADDSSRISRDLADALRVLQILKFHGVRVVYVAQQIDSAHEQAETLVTIRGLVDGLFLRDLRAKIQRGLAGQLERGFATGSVTFGYRTVPVQDPTGRRDLNGNPVLVGKRVEVVAEEAAVVVRIFESYAAGLGIYSIAAQLNGDGARGPRGGSWRPGAIKRVLVNEKYLGRLIWGQRAFDRRPGTAQKVARAVPRDEWRVQAQPELRIVSDDLWARVEARRRAVRSVLPPGRSLMRGRNAALYSKHLFSGFARCGTCGGAIVIVSGGHTSPRYGCPRSWRSGTTQCANRLTVRAKVADPRLLAGLKAELLAPATVQYITEQLGAALNRQLEADPRRPADIRRDRAEAERRLSRLIEAIERGIAPGDVASRITAIKAEIAALDHALTVLAEPQRERLAVMPAWVTQRLADVVSALQLSTERTKAEFQRLALQVTMTPMPAPGGRAFYRAVVESDLPELVDVADLRGPRARSTTGRSGPPAVAAENVRNLAEFRARSAVDRSVPR